MVIGRDGVLPLPWLAPALARAQEATRGHALLIQAAPGAGALELGLALVQSRLCEARAASGLACGGCVACTLVQAHGHPDLFVLLPQVQRVPLGWKLNLREDFEVEDGKRKPSRQIRIDDVRELLEWVSRTAARGAGKQVLIHPAEALNDHAASALLKTAEEPPAGTRLVITCADPASVLPTIRSRCQLLRAPSPAPADAERWLGDAGVQQPQVLLAACDGQPLAAQALAASGIDAAAWHAFPLALTEGRGTALARWPLPWLLDASLKLCHDAMALAAGGAPRYFPAAALPGAAGPRALGALAEWQADLLQFARAADHPWNEPLAVDGLVARARRAFVALAARPPASRGAAPGLH